MNTLNLVHQQTLSELKAHPFFDWGAFLKKKTFTPNELDEATSRALDWVTCACGNTCRIIERTRLTNSPIDPILYGLGHKFTYSIHALKRRYNARDIYAYYNTWAKLMEACIEAAQGLLRAIEKRAAFLIDEIVESLSPIEFYNKYQFIY